MDIWTLVNSPFVLTVLTLVWGSIVASRITALWQKRNHHHELKLQYAKEIVIVYQEYVRLVRGNKKITKVDFDELHATIVSNAKIIEHIYDNEDIGKSWIKISDKLSNVFNLRIKGRNESLIEKKMVEVYVDSHHAIGLMFNELKQFPK